MDVELHRIAGSAPAGSARAVRLGQGGNRADGAVRDVGALVSLGLPVWTRWVRSRGAWRASTTCRAW